jgi:hypothetical protein
MLFVILLVACGPELPEGWEDAEPIDDLVQADCDGSPMDEGYQESATASTDGQTVSIELNPVTFRCEQTVEGFWKEEAGHLEVLVQPQDMNPGMVAGCDCAYRIDAEVASSTATSVSAWRRWDDLNNPNDPVLVGEISLAE